MINVNQITSQLAKMPDQALQKYAAMNKNDPYILALAVAESNRRKEMRTGAQGMQGMQPQPKVADQAVASMAAPMPETVGIGQLPTGDMNFADGGIVAFADGGDVERYNGEFGSFLGGLGFGASPEQLAEDALRIEKEKRRREEEARYNALAEGRTEAARAPVPYDPATATRRSAYAAAPYADAAPRVPPAPSAAPASPAAAPAAAGLPGLPTDLTKLRSDIYAKQDFKDPAEAQVRALGEEMVSGAQRRQREYEDFVTKQGDVFKGREERLSKREADIGKQMETNKGLAFLNAGLAIMSTPGGLATAIGKGARVGTEQFAAGLDKIRAAQERLADARDKMDELRLNRDDLTFKQRAALSADIDRAKVDAQKLSIDGIRLAADVNEKRASDIYTKTVDVGKTVFEQQQATARTNAQIQAVSQGPERQAFNSYLQQTITKDKPQGDPAKAYEMLLAGKREPQTVESLMRSWSTNTYLQVQYPNPQDYIKMMQGAAAGGAPQFSPSDRALIEKYTR